MGGDDVARARQWQSIREIGKIPRKRLLIAPLVLLFVLGFVWGLWPLLVGLFLWAAGAVWMGHVAMDVLGEK